MSITVRGYTDADLPALREIWNQVVDDGVAFPQEDDLTDDTARDFFAQQSFTAVAERNGEVVGLYILHPNNVGRCGHIANASYAVDRALRGRHVGELLVRDCLQKAKELGFAIMQFNAVVASNHTARHLYERLGFVPLGVIPGGFRMKDGHYEDICPYYRVL